MSLEKALEAAALRRQLPRPAALRRARQAAGIPMTAVARHVGVDRVTILRWETGERTPRDPDVIRRYLEALGLMAARSEKPS